MVEFIKNFCGILFSAVHGRRQAGGFTVEAGPV
jgi:hypothetical protein